MQLFYGRNIRECNTIEMPAVYIENGGNGLRLCNCTQLYCNKVCWLCEENTNGVPSKILRASFLWPKFRFLHI